MTAYLVKRLLIAIPVLLLTALLVFSALHLAGGDPVLMLTHPNASQETKDAVRAKLGLDKPLPVQFVTYMSNVIQGDLGRSISSRKEVSELISEKLLVTLELGLAAFLLAYTLAIPLGMVAALNHNKFLDWFTMFWALLGVSVAGFWLGLMLMYVFSAQLKWLPPTGHGGIEYLILPTLALALPRVGRIARITRSSLLEVIGQDYIRTARAKGLSERAMVYRHALRNALIPIISLMGLDLGYIVGGAVVIEAVFARPGIGDMMLRAIYSRDFPVLQGCMFVLALAIILSNILADLAYVVVDPRIRHES
jgi:ABC-type dipeptide/oligopeptide/nickel transport system permease component